MFLLAEILFDGIGLLSFVIPFIGEFLDIIWAPVSAFIILKMYKGTEGKIGTWLLLLKNKDFLELIFRQH